jgi:hypothetical protein
LTDPYASTREEKLVPRAKSYQVGDLHHYGKDDPVFDNWDDAVKHAFTEITGNGYLDIAAGIWSGQDEGSELLAIVYQGEVFKK